MTNDLHASCPDTDTLAAFAEGKLPRRELPEILAHLEGCARCTMAVEAVNETLANVPAATTTSVTPSRWWLLAAAIVVALLAIPVLRRSMTRDPVSRLVALAPADARVVEPRLSGGFPWAEYRGPLRDENPLADPQRLKLAGAAGELAEDAAKNPTASAQHAAGVAMVLIDRPEEAIARLEAATKTNDAKSWNDLAAARYAAAKLRGRASLYPEALAAVDRALKVEPQLPEARFNRALILERMGLAQQARAAWQDYLAVDSGSPWAAEARQRLARIPSKSGDADFRKDLPRLESAAVAGDTATVAAIVRAHPQRGRSHGEGDYVGRWGEAVRRGDGTTAARTLTIARQIGDALQPIAGETLLRDAVKTIDTADAPRRALLAEGHEAYRRGRIAFSKQLPAAAEPDFRLAAARLAAGESPMALVARYYAASAAYERNEVARAAAELEGLLREVRTPALDAQVRWELALCRIVDGDWEGALALLESAQATFARLGERGNEAFIEGLLSATLVSLGRPDDAWSARTRAFEALSAAGDGDRLARSLGEAARMAMRAGDLDAALPLLHLEQAMLRDNDVLLANALMREATLNAARGDVEAALRNAADSAAAARRVSDPALRTRAEHDAQFATATAVLPRDPQRAKGLLDQAIAGYESRQFFALLPESYLLRARAALRLGAKDEAARDLDRGIAFLEKHPIYLGSVAGTGVLDAGTALFEEAIGLALDRGDRAEAFVLAERRRGSRGSAEELTRRLAGSGTIVLEIVALPEELVAFYATGKGLTVTRRPFDRARLAAADEAALYEALIRPIATELAHARELIVVADPLLSHVPFAALYDATEKRYLVEKLPVAMAASAFSLRRHDASAPRSVLAIALPSGDAAALPESEQELHDVAELYGRASSLSAAQATFAAFLAAAGSAEVLHIAGHTERQPGRGDAALMFAPDERVSWKRIAAAPIGKPSVVVLAACETLRTPAGTQQRALSLGGGFLAAGAGAVIGTLTPINDVDARALFRTVHRELAAGAGASEALRRAQIEALNRDRARRDGGWRSVALLTNRITT